MTSNPLKLHIFLTTQNREISGFETCMASSPSSLKYSYIIFPWGGGGGDHLGYIKTSFLCDFITMMCAYIVCYWEHLL